MEMLVLDMGHTFCQGHYIVIRLDKIWLYIKMVTSFISFWHLPFKIDSHMPFTSMTSIDFVYIIICLLHEFKEGVQDLQPKFLTSNFDTFPNADQDMLYTNM